ncbi:MAG TPA: SRPBCC domain-containing protein [Vicinamibacterales bacterium]
MPSIESEHEILSERVLAAPPETVFEAFAEPAVLARWWGPQGSVNLFEIFEFRAGGRWEFVMRAEDGSDCSMRQRFIEVRPPERVVVQHLQAGHDFELRRSINAADRGAPAADTPPRARRQKHVSRRWRLRAGRGAPSAAPTHERFERSFT